MTIQMVYEINNTYMAIDGSEIEHAEDYRHKMLQNNTIKGVLSPEIRVINNEKKYFVDISGKESLLNRFGTRIVDRREARELFEGIYCVTETASKYMISENDIVFRPEMIFKNPVTKKYEFLAIPFKDKLNGKEGMKELLQFLMMRLDNNDEKLVNAIYGIHSMYSDATPRFSVAFEFFLSEIREETEPLNEEPEESETFSNNISLQRRCYVPETREVLAVTMCLLGLVLIGVNLYWMMLPI